MKLKNNTFKKSIFIKKNLYNNLLKNYNSINNSFRINNNKIKLKQRNDNNFLDPSIKKHIKNYKYKHIYISDDINTTLVYYTKKPKVDSDEIDIIQRRILIMKTMFNNRQKLLIEIWPSPFTKKLPFGKVIGSKHVNSGVTFMNAEGDHIQIWRKEELVKVLIHELLHHLRIDENIYNSSDINHKLYKKICYQNYQFISANEIYVELYSLIINLLLYLIENSLEFTKLFKEMISEEIEHSLEQTVKILKYNGLPFFADELALEISKIISGKGGQNDKN